MDYTEFVKQRKNFIGASDAPVIMGVSPWKTVYQLWQDKLGLIPDAPDNPAMKRGRDLEPIARDMYAVETGVFVEPRQIFHPGIGFMMANLDGIDENNTRSVEIKCPGEKDHDLAKSGIVPPKYYPQLQHQVEILYTLFGIDEVDYFSFRNGDTALITVKRDQKYTKKMLSKHIAFWELVTNLVPPELSDRDKVYEKRIDEQWKEAAMERVEINREMKLLEDREFKNRAILTSLAGDKNSQGFGVKVTSYPRKGLIDYKSIPQLKGIDLELYRRKETSYWKVSVD